MGIFYKDKKIKKIYYGNKRIHSVYYGSNRIWVDAHKITFIENGVPTTIEYDDGATVNRQTAPDGAAFVGWSKYSDGRNPVSNFVATEPGTWYRVIKNNNDILVSNTSKKIYLGDTWKPYTLDANKYNSFNVTANVTEYHANGNGTTVNVSTGVYFNNLCVRAYRIPTNGPAGNNVSAGDMPGHIGNGGATFTISNLMSLVISLNGGTDYTRSDATVTILSITGNGKTVIG